MTFYAASAVAHPNIALAKYWGKRDGAGNYPAVPSLSVTLDGMATRTTLRFDERLSEDRFVLGNELLVGRPLERLAGLVVVGALAKVAAVGLASTDLVAPEIDRRWLVGIC